MAKTLNLTAEIANDREILITVPEDFPIGRVRITVTQEDSSEASTLGDLLDPEFFGMWKDRTDIVDTDSFASQLRHGIDEETRAWKEQSELAFAKEVAAFERMKPELIEKYGGQYVAIYQERLVGHGEDKWALLDRVIEQFGEVPCYIEKAEPNTPRRVRIPTVWIVRK
jgi:hypothetical protein